MTSKAKSKTRKPPTKKIAHPPVEEGDVPRADGVPVHCAHDRLVPIGELSPHPRNPNTHPPSQIELLAKVIAAQGWRAPITVSTRSQHIVRGHGRLAAAQHLGVCEVPVDYQDYPDDESELADLLADNRLAELAEIDRGILRDVIAELDSGEVDMDLTGFDFTALEDVMVGRFVDIDAAFETIDPSIAEKKPMWIVVRTDEETGEQISRTIREEWKHARIETSNGARKEG